MAATSSFIQKCFYEISLEKRPDLWQDEEDTEEKNVERIKFLATFDKTSYKPQLDQTCGKMRRILRRRMWRGSSSWQLSIKLVTSHSWTRPSLLPGKTTCSPRF